MPGNRVDGEELAKEVADLYSDATAGLVRRVVKRLTGGIDEPGWAEMKLAEVDQLRREAMREVARVTEQATDRVTSLTEQALEVGADAATDDLERSGDEVRGELTRTDRPTVEAFAREAVGQLDAAQPQILRGVEDGYRRAVRDTAGRVATGGETRREAAARAVERMAADGLGGFTDSAGRTWEIESYAEMATRTATGRASVAGYRDTLQRHGRDLVIVSASAEPCPQCDPWEGAVLSMSGDTSGEATASTQEAESAGLLHANCFPGEVLASGPPVRAADARWYEGDLVVVHTAGGDELPVTPNHPIATPEGWVAAGLLDVGGRILRYRVEVERDDVGPGDVQVPTRIGEVFGALRQSLGVVPTRVPATPEQFHGDGGAGDVHVVRADGLLHDRAVGVQRQAQVELCGGGAEQVALAGASSGVKVGVGAGHAADGVVGGGSQGTALCRRHAREAASHGLAPADPFAALLEPQAHGALVDAEVAGYGGLGVPGPIALDDVIHVGRREFRGHVYNLQTRDGWYAANGIIAHNCRHEYGLYLPGVTDRPDRPPKEERRDRYQARQRQREIERRIREWKRRAEAAEEIDPDQAQRAREKVRQWQAEARRHADEPGAKRRYDREQLGAR